MFELVQVNEKTYYIESPAKIGVYVADGTDVYLIDSGNDKDAGRKIRKLLDENNIAVLHFVLLAAGFDNCVHSSPAFTLVSLFPGGQTPLKCP